jgi:hypothetical protein
MKKSKYPKIEPLISHDKNGKPKEVYLKYDVYLSIFEEIKELEDKIAKLKTKQLVKHKAKKSKKK